MERVTNVFQHKKESDHILNINEKDFPEAYRDIIRKLQRAISDEKVQNTMDVEDEIIAELEEKERRIGDLLDSISEKDSVISAKDKLIEELKRRLGEL